MNAHQRLATAVSQLCADELEVLTLIAERLLLGQRCYGLLRLATDQRDFAREAMEEVADAAIYGACAIIRERQRAANVREVGT